MGIERYFELQDKLLALENALQHYGMEDESKTVFCLLEDMDRVIIDEKDTSHVEERCLNFLAKYKHVRDRFNWECV